MKHTRRLFCLFLTLCTLAGVLPAGAAPVTVAVSGLDAPQAGELIDFTAVSALPAVYTVDEVCWYRASGEAPGQMLDTACQPGEYFTTGRYLCRVYLTFAAGTEPTAGAAGTIGGEPALLGLWRGRWFLECSYTAKPSTRITALAFGGIDAPNAGNTVREHLGVTLAVPAGCTITDVSWSLAGAALAASDTFRAGDQLSCAVTVRADTGYRFADHPTATLCGKISTAAVELTAAQVYRFVFLFTVGGTASGTIENITVGSVSLTADAPTAGQSPAALTVSASTGVSVIRTDWTPADTAFAAGQSYTLTVTLAANAGYAFPQGSRPVVALNGSAMQIATADSRTLTASYTFAPAADPYIFPFTDVPETAWYYQWVQGAHRMGLINGKTTTTYVPDANMNWAEAVKLAACMHQLYHNGAVTLENGDPWYMSYLDYCRAQGIVPEASTAELPGYADIAARAGEPITRAEYVWLFSRALPAEALPAVNTIPDNSIPDVKTTDSALDDGIYLFYRAGILNGMDAYGTFSPDSHIRRSDVAAILMRLMDASYRVGAPAQLGK
ncbi:MAG: S-layer homology domain-containing protein [Clostridia bacterium]|nr:S-layer homology domain-containing protein [Clostridia bacterium]